MEKGDIHVSYGRKGPVVSDIGEQIFLGLFILVKILPLCLCQWSVLICDSGLFVLLWLFHSPLKFFPVSLLPCFAFKLQLMYMAQ